MNLFATIEEKWNELCEKTAPARKKLRKVLKKTGRVLRTVWIYVHKFRGIIASVPVAVAAIWLALRNLVVLPESVGINLLENGDYSLMVVRPVAVLTPLLLTLVCIFLTACSKRTLFPWMVSVLSLLIPLLIWVTNVYPA